MANQPRSHQIASDSPQYDDAWARDILDAIGKRAARRILADYKAIAGNKRLAKADRDVAAKRVKSLQKLL